MSSAEATADKVTQTNRQTDRQTHTHTDAHTHTREPRFQTGPVLLPAQYQMSRVLRLPLWDRLLLFWEQFLSPKRKQTQCAMKAKLG